MNGYVNFNFFAWVQCMAIFITILEPCTAPTSTSLQPVRPINRNSSISVKPAASNARRISQELRDIKKDPTLPFSVNLVKEDDINNWTALLHGPKGSPYEGGIFKLSIQFPTTYPFDPPKVKFMTRIYHPNIDESGNICLSILKNISQTEGWSSILKMSHVLMSISSLLTDPNADDPLVPEIAQEYKKNPDRYFANALNWTLSFATGKF